MAYAELPYHEDAILIGKLIADSLVREGQLDQEMLDKAGFIFLKKIPKGKFVSKIKYNTRLSLILRNVTVLILLTMQPKKLLKPTGQTSSLNQAAIILTLAT